MSRILLKDEVQNKKGAIYHPAYANGAVDVPLKNLRILNPYKGGKNYTIESIKVDFRPKDFRIIDVGIPKGKKVTNSVTMYVLDGMIRSQALLDSGGKRIKAFIFEIEDDSIETQLMWWDHFNDSQRTADKTPITIFYADVMSNKKRAVNVYDVLNSKNIMVTEKQADYHTGAITSIYDVTRAILLPGLDQTLEILITTYKGVYQSLTAPFILGVGGLIESWEFVKSNPINSHLVFDQKGFIRKLRRDYFNPAALKKNLTHAHSCLGLGKKGYAMEFIKIYNKGLPTNQQI